MKKLLIAGTLLLASAAQLSGQADGIDSQIKALCELPLKTALPAEAGRISAPKVWPACYSYRLEAGIGIKVDYVAARRCAWAERLAIQAELEQHHGIASVLGGSAMLSVLYANGEGVEKSLPLARRFVCETGGSLGDLTALLDELDPASEEYDKPKVKFSFCDQTGSGYMQGWCAAYDKEIADRTRAKSLHALSAGWPESQISPLNALVQGEKQYSSAHAAGERNIAGTARAAEQIWAEQGLRDEFLASLKSFEAKDLPNGSAQDFAAADLELNRVYCKAIADAESKKSDYGAVQPKGIRSSERAWLKYRDAWLAFAKLRYPSVTADAWRTLLTTDRVDVLKETLCQIGTAEEPCDDEVYEQGPSPLP